MAVLPSALAVFRSMTSSKFVDSWIRQVDGLTACDDPADIPPVAPKYARAWSIADQTASFRPLAVLIVSLERHELLSTHERFERSDEERVTRHDEHAKTRLDGGRQGGLNVVH